MFQLKHNFFTSEIGIEYNYNYWSIYNAKGKLVLATKSETIAKKALDKLNHALAEKISLIATK